MLWLRNSLLFIVLLLAVAGCSTSSSEGTGLEDLEDEFGITEGEDAEMPSRLPSDLYVTDDMEIDFTVENEIMSQLSYKTEKSYDELKELYKDYLNNNNAFGEVEESISEDEDINYFYAAYFTEFEGNPMDIMISEDDSMEGFRSVNIAVYDEDALDEMLEEMEQQMQED